VEEDKAGEEGKGSWAGIWGDVRESDCQIYESSIL